MSKPYYITTPIYYSNVKPHIGTAYCSIATDIMSRYKKARGYDVKFLTGNDEHGQKNEQSAAARGVTPQQHVDEMAELFIEMAKTVDVDYDIYWRTTNPVHKAAVQKIFKTLYDKGDIYKGAYEGLYCVPCETFFSESQLNDGKCPDCSRDVQEAKEEAYFFRMSKYSDALLAHIEANPEFIMPEFRKVEMVNNFIKPGLADVCVSRTSFKWGIPVDFDPGHVVYVWIDALSNYANALGYMSDDDSEYKKYWPADCHVVGKDIIRFHTLIWPTLMLALGEPLPKQIFGHGFIISEGKKMSKSIGNVIDPILLVNRYGSDAVRYFLMSEFVWGQDGNFRYESMLTRMNADLANDLGNLLSRTVGMIEKYFGGTLPDLSATSEFDADLVQMATEMPLKAEVLLDKMNFSEALNEIWNVIRRANKYCDENQPWVLCKDESKQPALANVLYHLAETLRIVSIVIEPVMPKTPAQIRAQFDVENIASSWDDSKTFGLLPKSFNIIKSPVLFPRLDIKKELEALLPKEDEIEVAEEVPEITIDEFAKVELKIGEVLECEAIEGTRLLKSQIKVGSRVRQIVSGIANFYEPSQMIGKKVVVVTNLKPVKLRGVLSEGMILCASEGKGKKEVLSLVTIEKDVVSDGAIVR